MSVFTIEEIRHYLNSQSNLKKALNNLSEYTILTSIPPDDFNSLNFEKNEENLKKYEDFIGMTKKKIHQRTLYRNTDGKVGRYWLACSPRWIEDDTKLDTNYKIAYWVNYGDDETFGLYTVEQIQKWFNNPSMRLYEIGGTKEK